jgi:uncharacterized membrane protein
MYFLTITAFLAHLHPALVHLPIGILLAALLLQLLARWERFSAFRPAIPIVLLVGLASAVLSCVTGFLLYSNGDYDDGLVSAHLWLAIALTFTAFSLYAWAGFGARTARLFDRKGSMIGVLLFLLITVTGHFGGSLTHGEDYLSSSFHNISQPPAFRPIADVQQAAAYEDIVKPILESRCNNCHGSRRQKGGLRLDSPDGIARGGKDGGILVAGKADSSELIKRILLPDNEEHHMPPKDRPQLSSQEQQLLTWWVDQGGDYRKLVKDLPQPEKVRGALLSLQNKRASEAGGVAGLDKAGGVGILPEEPMEAADAKAVQNLRHAGVIVMPMAENSHYLTVAFASVPEAAAKVSMLLPLKKQMVELNLSNVGVGDKEMDVIKQCKALRIVNLKGTRITDGGLSAIFSLPELRVLNLGQTGVTAQGLQAMRPPAHLHVLYLFQTRLDRKYWDKLKLLYRTAILDSGGYTLPVLTTDTAIVRPAVRAGDK